MTPETLILGVFWLLRNSAERRQHETPSENALTILDRRFADIESWTRSAILNTACSGKFSTDRTIGDYNRDIWKLPSIAP